MMCCALAAREADASGARGSRSFGDAIPGSMPSSSSSSSSEDRTRRATRRFLRAARKGNLFKLKRRFRKCPSLDIEARVPSSIGDGRDAQDAAEGGRTAMHLACAAGAEDVVKWLIKRGADVTAVDDFGNTPAHLMAPWAPVRPTAMDRLRRAGADLNLRASPSEMCVVHNGNTLRERHLTATRAMFAATLASPRELAEKAIERSRVAREDAEARRRRRREDERAEGGYEGLGDVTARVDSANARAWREKLLKGAEADSADVLHEPVLFDRDATEKTGGFAFSPCDGSYARFFESFFDDDDDAKARDSLEGVRFEEEEDAYSTYASSRRSATNGKNAKTTETAKRSAARDARARAASARDLEAQRVLDEARRHDAEWRAHLGAEAKATEEGTDVRRSGRTLRSGRRPWVSNASEYRRTWGVVAAMADRGEAIAYDDLPWPTMSTGEAAEMREEVRRAVLGETAGKASADLSKNARALLRAEMLRWHPDKFNARLGGLIVEADRDRVRARVNVVARIVAALFQEAR